MRASPVPDRQPAGFAEPLRCRRHAATSRTIVSRSGMRLSRHCRDSTPGPVPAMSGQEPCFGVWWTPERSAGREAMNGLAVPLRPYPRSWAAGRAGHAGSGVRVSPVRCSGVPSMRTGTVPPSCSRA